MVQHPQYHLSAEIRRILDPASVAPEVLIRVRGRHYDPDRPETFLHVRARDVRGLVRTLGTGREVKVLLVMTARFVEEAEGNRRSLLVDARPGNGTPPGPLRVVGYDTRVAGKVIRLLDDETMVLDAGIPLLVRVPQPTGLPRVGDHVEFLLHEPTLAELF